MTSSGNVSTIVLGDKTEHIATVFWSYLCKWLFCEQQRHLWGRGDWLRYLCIKRGLNRLLPARVTSLDGNNHRDWFLSKSQKTQEVGGLIALWPHGSWNESSLMLPLFVERTNTTVELHTSWRSSVWSAAVKTGPRSFWVSSRCFTSHVCLAFL